MANRDARRVLILGGTEEARILADRLAAASDLTPITSLAGRTATPARPSGGLRIGGFGGVEPLAAYLVETGIVALVDATHPFAARISEHAAVAAEQARVPLIRLERPPWLPEPGDRWTLVPDAAAAAAAQPAGARLFLAIGRQTLGPFETIAEAWFLLRVVDPPTAPLMAAAHRTLVARGPFAVADEIALLRTHRIERIVVRNSGAAGSAAKLTAARALGLPVTMIERPPLAAPVGTAGLAAATVDEACALIMDRRR